jgi:hypothetical protein
VPADLTHEVSGMPALDALLRDSEEVGAPGGGWDWVLSDLKTLLETGTGFAGRSSVGWPSGTCA